jgi:hypothetical protein
MHGTRAGLLAGLALGLVEIVASTLLRGDPWLPFAFAAAMVVGPDALTPAFPVAASMALGTVIHVLLSVVFGVTFLAALALTFQLSARPWLMLLYGVLFGALVWEVDFLAVLPVIAPDLTGRLDLCYAAVEWHRFILPRLRPSVGRICHLAPSRSARSLVAD